MKQTIITLSAILLFITATIAQNFEPRHVATPAHPNTREHIAFPSNSSRAIIYSEGFELTSLHELPTGWTVSYTESVNPWITINDNPGQFEGVINGVTPNSGERSMGRSWVNAGKNGWAFTPAIPLIEGVEYTISFYYLAPGYPDYNEYDDFEVKIGQTPTPAGMNAATELLKIQNTRITQWTLSTSKFTPTVSESYYLAFHDLNTDEEGIYIVIDDIEISGGSDCPSIKNMSVNYAEECGRADLTWTAPASGEFTYAVYRDGREIAIVEQESYSDLIFEPSLEHTWSVKVVCADGYSQEVSVLKYPCVEADCAEHPKNLSVNYTSNCDAVLKWNAPTEILYDNPEEANFEGYGYSSTRWLLQQENQSRNIVADDFVIPSGEKWYISEVSFQGFHNTTQEHYDAPDYFGVALFFDNGSGLPGSNICEFPMLSPIDENMSASYPIVVLPETVELMSGTYWISCYGVYERAFDTKSKYFISLADEEFGAPCAHLDQTAGPEWESYEGSLYFRIFGQKGSDPIAYNIYRDGLLIEANLTETSYTDTEFDRTVNHRWSVKTVCSAGGVSAAAAAYMPQCITAVYDNENTLFRVAPNPTSNQINITAEGIFNRIEVINFLGQTVISQPNADNYTSLDVSNLNNGVYFVRITSENGTAIQKFVKK